MANDGKSPAELPPTRPYNSPSFRRDSRARSNSSRASASSPRLESPRTLCPKDGDAFCYKPCHLPAWYLSDKLWNALPQQFRAVVTDMQHAGAAVSTGFERVQILGREAKKSSTDSAVVEDSALSTIDMLPIIPRTLPKLRTDSVSSSQPDSSNRSQVQSLSPSSSFGPSSPPHMSTSDGPSPVSPMCLTPLDAPTNKPLDGLKRERSFSTPLEPTDAYYATELSQLRTEAMPRLRHKIRKVESDWADVKRTHVLDKEQTNSMENWLAHKKVDTLEVDEASKTLADAIGLTPNGMGWTAP
ncbi:hypothetical protein BU24DRAFT_461637 [Aaosphaeria arxii CBS 175.79]|uniref:Uncharacterized protein n=1 Tax=Aaosphaeria arxii CBS 175.79 TaxID=1450172 RepID=A0A6A5XQ51_9PLEO|nr:uncharacterized protein BU24DRAFT_461637 [Aaosphaeria arxii CBS 175.79]KAF2015388.1 hypothetical protein BU24DRAFT_461637 [Aaosphaeria arxii CBS 175.79]